MLMVMQINVFAEKILNVPCHFSFPCLFQENYVDSKGASSYKCDHTSSMLCGKKGLGPDQLQITPSKPEEGIISDPLTPTANLKLLINAASPDIRVREMKKILFRPIENENAVLDNHSQV